MNESDDPILAAWNRTLAGRGSAPAIFAADGSVTRTFAGIEERARFFAREFANFQLGEVVAIQIGNHPDWPALFLASLRRGTAILPLERSMSEGERGRAMDVCGADAVYAFVRGCGGDDVVLLRQKCRAPVSWQKRAPILLKLTSGTTAAPRAVCFQSAQLLADCENICDSMGISARDINFGVIPVSHSYGFSNLLTPLLCRGVALVLSNDRIPRAIADGLTVTRATVFPGMPVFYQSFCEFNEPPPWPDLRLCISAGAPLTAELAERFRAKFGREVHSFYGSSECGGICYVRAPHAIPGFVGKALNGVEIELLENSRARVRSDAVGDGYFPEPDETKLGDGVFWPDDLLEKIPEGYRIVGRTSDLINVAGKKVNPAEVEAELLCVAGVRAVVAFGRESVRRNEEVAACVVAEAGVSEAALLDRCRRNLSSWQVPRRIYLVDEIPVNERGKTSRRALAQRFRAGGASTADDRS